jgi:hypothetical protein
MSVETKRQALELFEKLQAEFPHLAMNIDPADSYVELSYTMPQQTGLAFDVHLNLQNDDELHLCVGAFWCSWFPLSKPDVVQKYHNAVAGVLAGRNRIVSMSLGPNPGQTSRSLTAVAGRPSQDQGERCYPSRGFRKDDFSSTRMLVDGCALLANHGRTATTRKPMWS